MYQSVRDVFTDFTAEYEGAVPWMYLDVKGLVTWVQNRLIDLDYLDQSAVDSIGTFDSVTEDAVRQLQADYQLSTDGRVGLRTYSAAGSCIPASEVSKYTN